MVRIIRRITFLNCCARLLLVGITLVAGAVTASAQMPALDPYTAEAIATELPRGWEIRPNPRDRSLLAERDLKREESPGIILAIAPYGFKMTPAQAAKWIGQAAGGLFKVTRSSQPTAVGEAAIMLERKDPPARCAVLVWPDPDKRFSAVAAFGATPQEFTQLDGLALLESISTRTRPAGMALAQSAPRTDPIPKDPTAINEITGIATVPNAPQDRNPGAGDVETRVRVDRIRSAQGNHPLLEHGAPPKQEDILSQWRVTELDSSLTPAQFDVVGSGFSIEFARDGRYVIHYKMNISSGVLHSGTETTEEGRYELNKSHISLKPTVHDGWVYNFNPKDKHPLHAENGPVRDIPSRHAQGISGAAWRLRTVSTGLEMQTKHG